MKEQFKVFLTAVMFYTRIPCPTWVDHSAEYINKSTRYFPLIGWIVGGFFGVSLFVLNIFFDLQIALVLAIVFSVLLTGAFHEDGFADVCDGFGGGWTKDKILTIMKDSSIGVYGAIGLIGILATKYLTIALVAQKNIFIFILISIVAHTLSRLMAVFIIFTADYVREDELSKSKPIAKKMAISDFIIAFSFGFSPYLLLVSLNLFYITIVDTYLLIAIPVLLFFATYKLKMYFKKWIGGYTGDCLGATQQIIEVLFYLILVIKWKYIW